MTLVVVDGYNMIGAWPYEKPLNLEDARSRLIDELTNFAGATGSRVIVVFDGHATRRLARDQTLAATGVEVIFSKKGETADAVIERLVDSMGARESTHVDLRVVSSDALVQSIVLSRGAVRVSAREMYIWIENVRQQTRSYIDGMRQIKRPFENELNPHIKKQLDDMRHGRNHDA